MNDEDIQAAWELALEKLATMPGIGPANMAFIRASKVLSFNDGMLVLAVPNDFTRIHIEDKAQEEITDALSLALNQPVRVGTVVDASINPTAAEDYDETPPPPQPPTSYPPLTVVARPTDIEPPQLNPKYVFETFVVGESNRFTQAACRYVAEQPAKAYNPLFIYGGSGLGKTHLLHAVGHLSLQMYPNFQVKYINSEEFTNDFINSVTSGQAEVFQRRYRNVDVLLIDDIQFLQGKEQTLEAFFHTFNALHSKGKQIVITSDQPPRSLDGFEERLRSRFEMGLLTDVQPPSLETRIAILRNKARSENLQIDNAVMEFIAERFVSNIRELEGALLRVTAFASLNQQPMTLAVAQMVLKDIMSDPSDSQITAALVKAQTASYFDISVDQLISAGRTRNIAEARQIAMYLCRELTDLSYPQIGSEFGRDHTTVIHATRKITDAISSQPVVYNHVTDLTNRIRQAARRS